MSQRALAGATLAVCLLATGTAAAGPRTPFGPPVDYWSGSWHLQGETLQSNLERSVSGEFGTLTLTRLSPAEGRERIEAFNRGAFLLPSLRCGGERTLIFAGNYGWGHSQRYPNGGEVLACTSGAGLDGRFRDGGGTGTFRALRAGGSPRRFRGWYSPVTGRGSCPSGMACKRSYDWQGACSGGTCSTPLRAEWAELVVSWSTHRDGKLAEVDPRTAPPILSLPPDGGELRIWVRAEMIDNLGQPVAAVGQYLFQLSGPLAQHARLMGARAEGPPGRFAVRGRPVAEVLLLVVASPELRASLYRVEPGDQPSALTRLGLELRVGAKLVPTGPPA